MRRWFLVRHGQTEWNRVGRAQGQADPPLNREGLEQADAVGARLAPVAFEAAYCSDLRRAADTAAPVMRGRDAPITYRRDLREKSFGEWEGMTYEEVRRRHPRMLEELFDERPDFAPREARATGRSSSGQPAPRRGSGRAMRVQAGTSWSSPTEAPCAP